MSASHSNQFSGLTGPATMPSGELTLSCSNSTRRRLIAITVDAIAARRGAAE
jgi:hypothetical protein